MKKTLLCVSFGTSVESARASIQAVEDTLRDALPAYTFARAFTSPTIRKILESRGEKIPSLPQVLEEVKGGKLVVQPTHLLYGFEYEQIEAQVKASADQFDEVLLGKPLLAGTEDLQRIAQVLCRAYPQASGSALLLMGHGTAHFAGVVYPALQAIFQSMGRSDIYIATVEGWPTLDEVLPRLSAKGIQSAKLVPLMLVAGNHALNDMAGEQQDSWKNRLATAGIQTNCVLQGLGTLSGVRDMYREHLLEQVGG